MKLNLKSLLVALPVSLLAMPAQAAPDLQDILSGLAGKGKTETTEQSGATSSSSDSKSSGGGLSDLLEGVQSLGNKLGIIPSKTVDVAYLQGRWDYKKPAVAFKSDNFLAKAGGVAASAKVESELAEYYKKVGFDKSVLSVKSDSTFTLQLSKIKLNGTIESSPSDGTLTFNFMLMGKKITSMTAYVNAETNKTMSITFDVSKLLTLVEKVASFSGNSTLKSLSALLNNYEGMTAGFYMTKTADKVD